MDADDKHKLITDLLHALYPGLSYLVVLEVATGGTQLLCNMPEESLVKGLKALIVEIEKGIVSDAREDC